MNSTADLWHIHCHVTYMALDALNVSSRIIHNNVLHSKLWFGGPGSKTPRRENRKEKVAP